MIKPQAKDEIGKKPLAENAEGAEE